MDPLFIVWILHNWKLLYSIFNFEKHITLEERITFISTYLDSQVFLSDLGLCIAFTIVVLISTYILLNFSRLIVNFFDKIITPRIYELTDKSSIVLKKDFESLRIERDRFEKRFELERDSRLKIQDDYEKLETKLKESIIHTPVSSSETPNKKKIDRLKGLLQNKETINAFIKVVDAVINKKNLPDSKETELSLRLNLAEKGTSDFNDNYTYNLTSDGVQLRELQIESEALNT